MNDDELKARHNSVQEDIAKLSPDKQLAVRSLQAQVQSEIDECNAEFFSDGMFRADSMLKRFGISGSRRQAFRDAIQYTNKGNVFVFDGVSLYKAHNETILLTSDYIRSLELTVTSQYERLNESLLTKFINKLKSITRRIKNG